MAASRAPDDSYVNVRSGECLLEPSAAPTERGLRVVMYRGEAYVVVGVYLARGDYGQRELQYVLELTRHPRKTPGNP